MTALSADHQSSKEVLFAELTSVQSAVAKVSSELETLEQQAASQAMEATALRETVDEHARVSSTALALERTAREELEAKVSANVA